MAGDFDEKTAMDTIKDSMGLTDEELSPQSTGDDDLPSDDGDFGDDLPSDDRQQGNLNGEDYEPEIQRQQPAQRQPQRPTPQQQQDPLRARSMQFDPRADFRRDQKGNLVDPRTGEIIARAGSEARIYQRIHKQATDYIRGASGRIQGHLEQERGKLNRAVEIGLDFERQAAEAKAQLAKINAYELPPDQLLEAGQLYKQAQTDPVGVLKSLLTRAALSGIDITQLGFDGGNLDSKSILDTVRQEIAKGVKPVQDFAAQRQQETERTKVEQRYLDEAKTQVEGFFQSTPAALPFMNIFHAVLSQPQFQTMSLGAIWDKLQLHLMRKGIDPFNPQQPQRQQQRQQTRGNHPSRSLPNGRGMAPGGNDRGNGTQNAGVAHPSKSYDAIIREILAENRG
jgi:hypothetical protein